MKRNILWPMFALAAITVALSACPAIAQDAPFHATLTGSPYPVASHGKYDEFTGSGWGTHVGDCTTEVYVDFKKDGTFTGYGTMTAANGDKHYYSFSGHFVAPGWVTATYQITGGSGRFADAAGNGVFDVQDDLSVGTANWTFQGTISF